MPKGIGGYGRYPDGHIGCPYAPTSESPCCARDGHLALADDQNCVGCNRRPSYLLAELRLAGAPIAERDVRRMKSHSKQVSAANYLYTVVEQETRGLVVPEEME